MPVNPSLLNPSYEEFTIYSHSDLLTLPANDNELDNTFTPQEYLDVENLDGRTVIQTSADGRHSIFLFKNKNTEQETISATWTGKSNLAPSSSTAYLQIYNRSSTTWETLDTDNTSSDTNFTLIGTQTTNLSNYFDDNYWISCRTYQKVI